MAAMADVPVGATLEIPAFNAKGDHHELIDECDECVMEG
jgi:hypothetical protein